MADDAAVPKTRRSRKVPHKEVVRQYQEYRRLGMSTKQAWQWAWKVTHYARDHWRKPRCGW